MNKKMCVLVILLFISVLFSFSQTKKTAGGKMFCSVGVSYSYFQTDIVIGDHEAGNRLIYPFTTIELGVSFSPYLELGAIAGFSRCRFDNPVDFIHLPLSLRLDNQKFKSVVLGLEAKSNFYSIGTFFFSAGAKCLYFRSSREKEDILLPIVGGKATAWNRFFQVEGDLLAHYRCSPAFSVFAGPQMKLVDGRCEVSEEIMSLEGKEVLKFKQKELFGLAAGFHLRLGGHVDIEAKLYMFSRISLSNGISYRF